MGKFGGDLNDRLYQGYMTNSVCIELSVFPDTRACVFTMPSIPQDGGINLFAQRDAQPLPSDKMEIEATYSSSRPLNLPLITTFCILC